MKLNEAYKNMVFENISFDNWSIPNKKQLEQEYHIEQELKGNEFWEDKTAFLNAVDNASIETITPDEDYDIDYRSHTTSKKELINLIKGYRSYPQYRNEETIENLYNRFRKNLEIDLPIVIQFSDGSYRVFSGNTRMDIAFQLGMNPKVLIVKADV